MNTKGLEYALTVAEEGSFSKAAKKLYISQPSLSQTIGAIEKELGVQLYDRSTIPLSVTYAGERYLHAAREILKIENNLRHELEDISEGQRGRIILGISQFMSQRIIPNVFPTFRKEYPNIELRLIEDTREKLLQSLAEGKADLILLNETELVRNADPNLKFIEIFENRVLLVSPRPLKSSQKSAAPNSWPQINLTSLKNQPFIFLTEEQEIRKFSNQIFRLYGIKPNILIETKNPRTALELTANGMGFTILYQLTVDLLRSQYQVYCYQFDLGDFKSSISVCHNRKKYLPRSALRLMELMRNSLHGTV
ncbi:MAG: hypothetical protein ACFWUC_02675 [Oscillospiraceae bacterium]|jgi:DNA-binding transcriptional LysR family regulator